MAKDKNKSKGKKKFKALEKGVGKSAKVVFGNVAPRVESFLQPEAEKLQAAGAEVAAASKSKVEETKTKLEAATEPVVEKVQNAWGPAPDFPADEAPKVIEEEQVEESPAPIEVPDDDSIYELADLFKAFADATRLRILFSLMDGGKCVADISEAAGVSQSATSHQLRSMKQANLVRFTRDGKQVVYSLASDNVQAMLAQGLAELNL